MAAEIETETDWYLVAYLTSSYIGIIVISLCTIHFIRATRHKKKMRSFMKYPALLSLSSAFVYCAMIALFRTNVPFRSFSFAPDGVACRLGFGLNYFFFMIARVFGYLLFLNRLELVFENSAYPVSKCLLYSVRVIVIVLALVYIPGVCIFSQLEQRVTANLHIAICTVDGDLDANYADLSIISFVVTDFLLCVFLAALYCRKLCHMSKILQYHDGEDELQQIANRTLQTQMVKASILVLFAVISTVLIVLIGNLFVEPISWFIPMDVTINAVCIYLMFGFSKPFYQRLCGICICCCRYCVGDVDMEEEDKAGNDASTADKEHVVDLKEVHSFTTESTTRSQMELASLNDTAGAK